MTIGPECPRCGEPVPFWAVQFGRGRPFPCRRCGQRLLAPKVGALAILAFMIFVFANREGLSDRPLGWLVVPLIILLIGVLEYALLKVRAVKEDPS